VDAKPVFEALNHRNTKRFMADLGGLSAALYKDDHN